MRWSCLLSSILIILSFWITPVSIVFGGIADEGLRDSIFKAFSLNPSEIEAPLKKDQIHVINGQGRVDVNESAKFSYFVQTEVQPSSSSTTWLIPMATSRFTPTYYQTDEWWDAHKSEIERAKREGRPIPKQDMNEVSAWLKQKRLSTNPIVFEIHHQTGEIKQQRLQSFLKKYIVDIYSRDGEVVLYRGGEKPGELDFWLRQEQPRGARYWTPTANYAWRYARKNPSFIPQLVEGKAPLFVFRVPVAEFESMVAGRFPRLTLGTELTKRAHEQFDRTGRFQDHLYSMDYLGEGALGVEIELRANRSGAREMARYFRGAISIQDLAYDRIMTLKKAQARLIQQNPSRMAEIEGLFSKRIEKTMGEARVLLALQKKLPIQVAEHLLQKIPSGAKELSYIDGFDHHSWVNSQKNNLSHDPEKAQEVLVDVDRVLGLKFQTSVDCGSVLKKNL